MLTAVQNIPRLIVVFFHDFLLWYFIKQPVEIMKLYIEYAKAFSGVFSIIFLLKTLVSPWKSIADRYPSNGLQLVKIVQVFTLNCTARAVGCVVRLGTIALALIIQVLLLAFFLAYFAAWVLSPLIVVLGVRILLTLSGA